MPLCIHIRTFIYITCTHVPNSWSNNSLPLQGGRIPYGALFGDVHGYSTMEEFVQYMDTYERDFNISQLGEECPKYIFDPVFLEDFREDYTLPGQ